MSKEIMQDDSDPCPRKMAAQWREASVQALADLSEMRLRVLRQDAVMRQALDALENDAMQQTFAGGVRISNAAIALRAALAAPEPEPVAWMVYTIDGKSAFVTDNPKDFTQDHRALPLYTTPHATAGEQR